MPDNQTTVDELLAQVEESLMAAQTAMTKLQDIDPITLDEIVDLFSHMDTTFRAASLLGACQVPEENVEQTPSFNTRQKLLSVAEILTQNECQLIYNSAVFLTRNVSRSMGD